MNDLPLSRLRKYTPTEAAFLHLRGRRRSIFLIVQFQCEPTFLERCEVDSGLISAVPLRYGRTSASNRMRTRLKAAMFNTNIWSTFFKPRTIT